MRIETLAALALGLTLSGCSGGGETDTSTADTDDPPDIGSGAPLTAEEAEQAYNATSLPVYLLFLFMDTESICPSVVEEDGSTTITTDCTDDNGTSWTGSASMVGEDITWNDLTGSKDGITYAIDGAQTMTEATGMLTSNLQILVDVPEGSNGDGGPTGDVIYTDHEIDLGGFFDVAFSGAGEYSVSGEMQLVDIGTFTLSGSVSDDGTTCDREPDEGTLTLDGSLRNIAYTHDGASGCDGCIPYLTSNVSGTLCLWNWQEGDTGADSGFEPD